MGIPSSGDSGYIPIGILSLIILNISKRQQYLYRWWTVSKLFLLNNGLLCSNSSNSASALSFCNFLGRTLAAVFNLL